jgi:hypothetical protein
MSQRVDDCPDVGQLTERVERLERGFERAIAIGLKNQGERDEARRVARELFLNCGDNIQTEVPDWVWKD